MTDEQFNRILELIDDDVKNKNYNHLVKLKNHLNEISLKFDMYDNPNIAENLDFLTTPLKDFLDELHFGPIKTDNLYRDCYKKFIKGKNKNDNNLYIFHLLMLDRKDILMVREWGKFIVDYLIKIINDLGFDVGMEISDDDQNKLLEYANKSKKK